MLISKRQYELFSHDYSELLYRIKYCMNHFGIYLKDGIDMTDLLKHTTLCKDAFDFNDEVNALCKYAFRGKKSAFFHGYKNYIFVLHFPRGAEITAKKSDYPGVDIAADCYLMIKNYTSSDVYFTFFSMVIYKFYCALGMKNHFINVKYLIEHTEIREYQEMNLNDFGTMELLDSYSYNLKLINSITQSWIIKMQLKQQIKEVEIRDNYKGIS